MRWTKDKLEWLKESKNVYDDREDILNAFNKHFNTDISLSLLTKNNVRYKLGLPKAYKILRENAKITQIKRRGFYKRPDDYEQTFKSGKRTFIKINNIDMFSNRKDGFVQKNRYLYEKYHNVKLDPLEDIIVFLDDDDTNFRKENLYRMKRSVHALLVNHRLYSVKNIDKLTLIKFCEWKKNIIEIKKGL